MGHDISRIHVCSLQAQPAATEFERWPISRVRNVLHRWRREGESQTLRTNALTEEDVFALLADDHGENKDVLGLQCNESVAGGIGKVNHTSLSLHRDNLSYSDSEGSYRSKAKKQRENSFCRFQAHIRGQQTRKRILTWRKLREELYFEGPSGPSRVSEFFHLFCSMHDTANPFDGRETIDALRFFTGLLLLCQGKSLSKAELLFEVFEALGDLNHEMELTVMLIIVTHSIAHVYDDCTMDKELFKAAHEETLERVAHQMVSEIDLSPDHKVLSFRNWALSSRPFSDWISRVCQDVTLLEFAIGAERWGVCVISQTDWPLTVQTVQGIGLFGANSSSAPLSHMSTLDPKRCLVVSEDKLCDAEYLYVSIIDDLGRILVQSDRVKGINQEVQFGAIEREFPRGVGRAFSFNISQEDWSSSDIIGVFDKGCPSGSCGAYVEQKLHRAIFQQRCVTFAEFPRPGYKLVWFDDQEKAKASYLQFGLENSQAKFARLINAPFSFEKGERVVARANVQRQASCNCKGNCTENCHWVQGEVLEIVSNGIKVRFVRDEDPEMNVGEFDFSAIISPGHLFNLALPHEVPSNGDRLLCQRPSASWEFLPCIVIDSGWLELRYMQLSKGRSSRPLCIARSEQFRLVLAPFELGKLRGTHIGAHIYCDLLYVQDRYLQQNNDESLQGDYVGLFHKIDPHSQLMPDNRDLIVRVSKSNIEKRQICFDAYYFKSPYGGFFEARYIHKGEITSISQPLILRPIVILRDVYQEKRGFIIGQAQRMVCQLEILDNAAWTCWDRVELILEENSEAIIAWGYVSLQRRDSQKVSVRVPDDLQPGKYRWRYTGFYSETCEVGKVFHVSRLTREDILADMDPLERQEAIAIEAAKRLDSSRHQAAVKVQCWARCVSARYKVNVQLDSKREIKNKLEGELAVAQAEYKDVCKSNARRSSHLISRRDRQRQENAREAIEQLQEQLAQLTAGVSAEQLEIERHRICALQEQAAEERTEREKMEAFQLESKRRSKIRTSKEVRRSPLIFPRTDGLCLDKSDTLAADELAEWVTSSGIEAFEDEDFPTTTASLYCSKEAWMSHILGSPGRVDFENDMQKIVWLRPKELFFDPKDKNALIPLVPEELFWRKIPEPQRPQAPEILAKLEAFHFALMTLADRSEHVLSHILDASHAELGMYSVKLFWKGQWVRVTIDDRFPATQINGRHSPLLTTSDPKLVGLWVYIIEKAVAKLFQSYEAAFAALDSVESALALLSGGVAMKFDIVADQIPGPEYEAWDDPSPIIHYSRPQGVTMPLHAPPNRQDLLSFNMQEQFPDMDTFLFAKSQGEDSFSVEIVDIKYSKDYEAEIASGLPNFIVVRKLLGQDEEPLGRRWRWNGEWANDNEEVWSDELREVFPDFDYIGDGTIWMPFEDFSMCFKSWSVCAIVKPGVPCASSVQQIHWKGDLRTCGGPRFPRAYENPIVDIETNGSTVLIQVFPDIQLPEVRVVQMQLANQEEGHPRIDVLCTENIGSATQLIANNTDPESYQVQLLLWAPGLEASATVRILSVNTNTRVFSAVNQEHLKLCKQTEDTLLQTPHTLTLNGIPEPSVGNELCPTCSGYVGHGASTDTIQLKGGATWHSSCAIKCSWCGNRVAEVMALDRGSLVLEPSCGFCWEERFADECKICAEVGPPALVNAEVLKNPDHKALKPLEILMDHVEIPPSVQGYDGRCRACMLRERLESSVKCRYCGIALLGDCMDLVLKDDANLHLVCQQLYIQSQSPTCAYCNGPICEVEGRFSGKARKCRLGVVHEECHAPAIQAAGRQTQKGSRASTMSVITGLDTHAQ